MRIPITFLGVLIFIGLALLSTRSNLVTLTVVLGALSLISHFIYTHRYFPIPGKHISLVFIVLLFAWTLVSALWSLDPVRSLVKSLAFGGFIVIGIVCLTTPVRAHINRLGIIDQMFWPLSITLSLIAVFFVFAATGSSNFFYFIFYTIPESIYHTLVNGVGRHGFIHAVTTYFHENNAVYDHRFNRFFTLTAMIFWPLAYYLLENKKTKNCLLLAGCLLLICIFSESAATVFALLTSVGVFMIAFFLPRAGMILVMVGTILMTYLMPWLASIGLRLTTPMRDTLPKGEIISRLEIWQAISTMIAENPVLGWGYRTSRQVYDLFYTQNPDVQLLVKGTTSHPHNNILEYWTELGVIGVSLWLGVMLSVLWRIKDLPNKTKAFALATFISYQAIAQVAYGAGQANWLAQTCFAVIVAGVIFAPRPTPQVDRSGAPSA